MNESDANALIAPLSYEEKRELLALLESIGASRNDGSKNEETNERT